MTINTKPAVVYIRGIANHSLEHQKSFIEQQVSGSAYHVVATFSDTTSGTTDVSRRPGLHELFETLQTQSTIHDVIVYDESRISRRMSEVHRIIQRMSDLTVKVHYALNGLGSNEASGTVARLVMMAERQVHGERIRRSIAQKRIMQHI